MTEHVISQSRSFTAGTTSRTYRCDRCGVEMTLTFTSPSLVLDSLGRHNYTDDEFVNCGGRITVKATS